MGLFKSPAGVPWNHGTALMHEEQTIYTDRLAEAWAQNPQHRAVLEESGAPEAVVRTAPKIAAIMLYGDACERIQAAWSTGQGWTIRQIAAVDERAYYAVMEMPFEEWRSFMVESVIPTLSENLPETSPESPQEPLR